MIRVTVSKWEAAQGLPHVVKKLRDRGIPVRIAFGTDIRLCQVWEGANDKDLSSGRCIGYGRLEWTEDCLTHDVEFSYYPPAGADVIDVEAREIIDQPLLTNDQRP